VGPVELAECFPVPGVSFRVVGQVVRRRESVADASRKSRRARPARPSLAPQVPTQADAHRYDRPVACARRSDQTGASR
jgi:hypothetical protein